jgi:oligogalacturonide transporter
MQEASMASNLLGTMAIFQFIAVIAMIPLCIRFGPAPSYRMVGFFRANRVKQE